MQGHTDKGLSLILKNGEHMLSQQFTICCVHLSLKVMTPLMFCH